ncbi:replication/maintenance protein RepL [Bacillus cereus]|uniref:replication/maintenance protein RepL n=1 Tax=Bacillus cereus TaxID=1396 RepID=UPI0015D4D406|nr:replication/maintenance protein RepL [Bacillus cereus]
MSKPKGQYLGTSKWVKLDNDNQPTGEVKTVDEFESEVRNGFMITYLTAIISLIEKLGTKKMIVVKYILENMSKSENTLIITTNELAQKTKVSKPVVLETLKLLEEAKLIKRRTGAIMLSAKLIHKGSDSKERYLMTRFHSFDEKT